ncbi:mechanosensitive ion channel family protein [Aliiruegeria sabulilitoris]|uniref:mechanosensitive ion channel family protein n=1 Tax=Aliiruegeria sabulilitoris TaxID=1510458 RepID=UPI000832D789|nr:mechanosensitive ion channel family protein [Aliiruegeria sabulilitoris]
MSHLIRIVTLALAIIGLIATVTATLSGSTLKSARSFEADLPAVRTESPKRTLATFAALKALLEESFERYQNARTGEEFDRVVSLSDELTSLIDLSDQPDAVKKRNGLLTAMVLLDVWDIIPPVDLDTVPDKSAMIGDGLGTYVVPDTPIRLSRIDEGERAGEYLFDEITIRTAPRFLAGLESETTAEAGVNWSAELEQFAGPWLPASWIGAIPPSFLQDIWGTPLWKVILSVVAGFLLFVVAALVSAALPVARHGNLLPPVSKLIYCASILPVLVFFHYLLTRQINVTGRFADGANALLAVIWFGTLAAVFWNAILACAAAIWSSRTGSGDDAGDSLGQMLAHLIALVGAVWIIAYGLQSLGFPALSVLAGLGIGGLAGALAIRPTLENLIGGFVLYIDKPIRVGDWCEFGPYSGIVEKIGVRSTNVRAMDRTIISIPNAQFVNMELINWARCDQMLINPTIGLIYDTSSDQLRYVLAEARRMAIAHPRIDSDTVRIRFAGYGESSLDIDVRVYAQATEWNDFFAIREDFLLRLKDIVEGAGTSFAFPSRTLYVSRDTPRDPQKTVDAEDAVDEWRRSKELPFPWFSSVEREKMNNSLRYPPHGSPDGIPDEVETTSGSEPLSTQTGNQTPLSSD